MKEKIIGLNFFMKQHFWLTKTCDDKQTKIEEKDCGDKNFMMRTQQVKLWQNSK